LSPLVDVALAADLVHTIHSENFRRFCALEHLSVPDLLTLARRQLRQLLENWLT